MYHFLIYILWFSVPLSMNHCIDFKVQEKPENNKIKETWKWRKIRSKETVSLEQREGKS